MENDEVNVLEFSLNNKEIKDLISKLNDLKEKGNPVHFDIDNENQLIIHKEGNE